MNEQDSTPTGGEVTRTGEFGSGAVRLDQGHIVGDGGIPERFQNPGFPPHTLRGADLDEAAAKRAERIVGGLFVMSILGTLGFIVAYFAIDSEATIFIPGTGNTNAVHAVLGICMALSLLGIGLGAVQWAKTLMSDHEAVEDRHPQRSADADRSKFVEIMSEGDRESQLSRRPLIKYALGGALGLFAVPVVLPLIGGLGPLPGDDLSVSFWNGEQEEDGSYPNEPLRLMRDPQNTPIKASEVTIGSVFHVMPEGLLDLEEHILEAKAKAAVIVMRLDPDDIKSQKEKDWGHQGIVAYSKICTHVGCPVGLYEQQTHHLLCPCHQSTFDVTQDCKVIFGPAKRPLPQLPITVDDEGYLISKGPFKEATGPSFWERGSA